MFLGAAALLMAMLSLLLSVRAFRASRAPAAATSRQVASHSVLPDGEFSTGSPPISWYPGHIAKAERELSDYLKKVDVVIEVRDARIPLSTTHPSVPDWVGQRPLIVAIARLDQISPRALKEWREYYAMNPAHPSRPDAKVYFIDGKVGAGVLTLRKQALKAG
jgi:ribosome biogenesis GTPase A